MHEIKLPQLGQSVEEASIVQWLKKEGDPVEQGELLFTVQTDKAEIECESTASGVLRKILVPEDELVPVMTVVAMVGEADEELPDLSQYQGGDSAATTPSDEPLPATPATQELSPERAPTPPPSEDGGKGVSPRARKRAETLGVDPTQANGSGAMGRVMEADVEALAAAGGGVKASPTAQRMAENAGVDLAGVQGTGPGGKVMKADVAQAAEAPVGAPATESAPATEGERVPLSPMRRVIAQRMVESKFSAPHYYVTFEVDMKAATAFRKSTQGFKPSFNDIVLYAVTKAIRQHPEVNVRWLGDAVEQLSDINLGFAVALPAGLIVPVIHRIQNMSLEGIQNESRALAEKARAGKLTPDEYSGSTFTVSNLGALGVDQFTAIINQPNCAILAVGRIKDRVVAVDGGIQIRPMMNLTLSSDHRAIDGAVAAQFMGTIRKILESAEF